MYILNFVYLLVKTCKCIFVRGIQQLLSLYLTEIEYVGELSREKAHKL